MASNEVLRAILGAEDYASLKAQPEADSYYNIQLVTRSINSIKPTTNKAAKVMLYQADTALDKAHARVHTWTPGQTSAEEIINKKIDAVRGKLDWHRQEISSSSSDENIIYDHSDDLKKWVIEAFVTFNESVQGKITEGDRSFYKEASQAFADLVSRGKKALDTTTNYFGWAVGITLIGVGAYAWYQIKMAKIKHGARREELPAHESHYATHEPAFEKAA